MTKVKTKEIPVGGSFELGGKTYKCVMQREEHQDSCLGCAFYAEPFNKLDCDEIEGLPECAQIFRVDENDVIFVEQ